MCKSLNISTFTVSSSVTINKKNWNKKNKNNGHIGLSQSSTNLWSLQILLNLNLGSFFVLTLSSQCNGVFSIDLPELPVSLCHSNWFSSSQLANPQLPLEFTWNRLLGDFLRTRRNIPDNRVFNQIQVGQFKFL